VGKATHASTSLNPTTVFDKLGNDAAPVESFQDIMDDFLPDFLRSRATLQENAAELDDQGQRLRPLTRSEVSALLNESASQASHSTAITLRKLKLIHVRIDDFDLMDLSQPIGFRRNPRLTSRPQISKLRLRLLPSFPLQALLHIPMSSTLYIISKPLHSNLLFCHVSGVE